MPTSIEIKVNRPSKLVALVTHASGTIVVKAACEPDSLTDTRGIRHLKYTGLPIPKILAEIPGPPQTVLLSYLKGEPLSVSTSPSALREVGEALRIIHALPPTSFIEPYIWRGRLRSWLDEESIWWVNENEGTKQHASAARNRLYQMWDDLKSRGNSTILVDGRPEHFLAQGAHLTGMFDLGEIWIGDPVMDFAVIAAHEPGILPGIIEGYKPTKEEQKSIEGYLPLYLFLRRVSAAHWCKLNGFEEYAPAFVNDILADRQLDNPLK